MHGGSQRGLWKWQAVDSSGTAPKPAAPNLTTAFGKPLAHNLYLHRHPAPRWTATNGRSYLIQRFPLSKFGAHLKIHSKKDLEDALSDAFKEMPSTSSERIKGKGQVLSENLKELISEKLIEWVNEVTKSDSLVDDIDLSSLNNLSGKVCRQPSDLLLDSLGMILGPAIIGTVGSAEILAKIGVLALFDPTAIIWVSGGIASAFIVLFAYHPSIRRWTFKRFISRMKDEGQRKKVVNKTMQTWHKKLNKDIRHNLSHSFIKNLLNEGVDIVVRELEKLGNLSA